MIQFYDDLIWFKKIFDISVNFTCQLLDKQSNKKFQTFSNPHISASIFLLIILVIFRKSIFVGSIIEIIILSHGASHYKFDIQIYILDITWIFVVKNFLFHFMYFDPFFIAIYSWWSLQFDYVNQLSKSFWHLERFHFFFCVVRKDIMKIFDIF